MWKIQLLDEDHILIKYSWIDYITSRVTEPNFQLAFFVIYTISTTKILAVYENTSSEMLDLYEKYCDDFRNANYLHVCSPSNNLYAKLNYER